MVTELLTKKLRIEDHLATQSWKKIRENQDSASHVVLYFVHPEKDYAMNVQIRPDRTDFLKCYSAVELRSMGA